MSDEEELEDVRTDPVPLHPDDPKPNDDPDDLAEVERIKKERDDA